MAVQTPLESWSAGNALGNFREIVFGNYVFPLTYQVSANTNKLIIDKRKVARVIGEYSAQPKSFLAGRAVKIVGTTGTGMLGTNNTTLVTATDVETELSILAGLQGQGIQKLWTRWDRYLNAELEQFDRPYTQDGGAYRYVDVTASFYAADPRYYSATVNTLSGGPYTDTANHAINWSHLGNTRAYPIITLTGACVSPYVLAYLGSASSINYFIGMHFSTLTMYSGDTLVISTDPRPNVRNNCAIYTHSGVSVNALQFVNTSTDIVNNYDGNEWLPFIEAAAYQVSAQQLWVGAAGAGSFTAGVSYNDTWI